MRILVTGASGLLGLNLALEAAKHHAVVGVTHSHGLREVPFDVRSADLLDVAATERLLATERPDLVVHCAALANVDQCEQDADRALALNATLPARIAAATYKAGTQLVHVSTDAVFDGLAGDYTEEDEPNPINVYGQTKLAGERNVLGADPQAVVARVNFYGWSLSGRRSLAEWFLNRLQSGLRTPGFRDVFFCPLLANELARILLRMTEAGLHGLYHVVSSEATSKYDFGVALARTFELDETLLQPTLVGSSGLAAKRPSRLTLSTGKASRVLGMAMPRVSDSLLEFRALFEQGYAQRLTGFNEPPTSSPQPQPEERA